MAYEANTLHLNEAKHQFEMEVDSSIAFIEYKQKGNTIYLIRTETPPELEGKGVASAMVEKTLYYLDEHHLMLVPLCSFVQTYLQRHLQWNRLVTED